MPITNYEKLISFSKMAGAEIPSWMMNRLQIYKDDEESLKAFGQEVLGEMCSKLKAGGVKDFHFYSMNQNRTSFIYSTIYYLEIGTPKNLINTYKNRLH